MSNGRAALEDEWTSTGACFAVGQAASNNNSCQLMPLVVANFVSTPGPHMH
jgi:hypothetical protein